jgi:ATP-binding cassette subfamily C protein
MKVVAFLQLSMSLLDLVGIFLVGIVATVSLFGIQSKEPPNSVQGILTILRIENFSFQQQVAMLGLVAGLVLVGKTLTSAYFSRKILFFLNLKTAEVITGLLDRTLKLPYDQIKSKSPTNLLFALTRGVDSLLAGVIGSASMVFAEVALLFVIIVGMFIFDPIITTFSIIYFGLIAILQGRRLNAQAKSNQEDASQSLVESEGHILNALGMYREFHIRNARSGQVEKLKAMRIRVANLQSKGLFMPYVAKYSIEISLVTGAILLTGSQLILKDALGALTTLSVFLVAATRVSPSILRLQQGLILFNAKCGESLKTLELILDTEKIEQESIDDKSDSEANLIEGEIKLVDVSFKYFDGTEDVIRNLDLLIPAGSMCALVGPSGNGKSTILDLMMGILVPSSGTVTIDGAAPNRFISRNPRAIGYVPQESVFFEGSLIENILLGLNKSDFSITDIAHALRKVGLDSLIPASVSLDEVRIGERGGSLSVGQRQRLSMARALITNPKVLFLDEPTSSLDADSERLIANLINGLRGKVTIVVIAHRLETIKNADQILFIENGVIKKRGNYEQVFS